MYALFIYWGKRYIIPPSQPKLFETSELSLIDENVPTSGAARDQIDVVITESSRKTETQRSMADNSLLSRHSNRTH